MKAPEKVIYCGVVWEVRVCFWRFYPTKELWFFGEHSRGIFCCGPLSKAVFLTAEQYA